jgi:hypothetical protein
MKAVLGGAAALEAVTGLVLMIQPSLFTRPLLGTDVAGTGVVRAWLKNRQRVP